MKIRKASKKDAEDIANIEWESGYLWNENKKECLKLARRIFYEGYCEVYVLEDSRDKIGYFAISQKGKLFYLNFFAIRKKFQGRGFSKLMMNKTIYLAKQNKMRAIELTVWGKNFPAISLYTKYGFYVTDIKRKYYKNGDDKLRMRKELK